jgi:hypothetical protein
MSIALAAMSDTFIKAAQAANIPLEVLHRIAAMASGGMDVAAQWRGHHAAGRHGPRSPAGLQGRVCDRLDQEPSRYFP